MNEAAKGLDIQVEVDRGMMTTARNKFTYAIFMKTSRLDPHSFSMEFEEYSGEETTCDADYSEIKIKSNNKNKIKKSFILHEIKLYVYDIDEQAMLEEETLGEKINQGLAEIITRHPDSIGVRLHRRSGVRAKISATLLESNVLNSPLFFHFNKKQEKNNTGSQIELSLLEEEEYSILDASKGEEDCVKFSDVAILEFCNTLHPTPEIMAGSGAWASLV